MPKITIYVSDYCPHCHAAVEFLKKRRLEFEMIDVSDPEQKAALKTKTGWQTVPQIFIDDVLIGGYQELLSLDKQGKIKNPA